MVDGVLWAGTKHAALQPIRKNKYFLTDAQIELLFSIDFLKRIKPHHERFLTQMQQEYVNVSCVCPLRHI